MKSEATLKTNLVRLKAVNNTKVVLLFVFMVFSSFSVNANGMSGAEQNGAVAIDQNQSYSAAVITSQGYYRFSSRPERAGFRNHLSSNDSLTLNKIVNVLKENVVISRTTLGINLVWKW